MGFLKKVGRFFDKNWDNIGTAAGVALGGPLGPIAGGAIGRLVGSRIGPEHEDTVGNMAGQAAIGGATGLVAQTLAPTKFGIAKESASGHTFTESASALLPEEEMPYSFMPPAQAMQTAPTVAASGKPNFAARMGKWFGGMKPIEQAAVAGQGIASAADIYSAHQVGRAEDEDKKRRKKLADTLAPYFQRELGRMRQ